MRNLIIATALAALLSACGTKGPLVMPPAKTQTTAPQTPAAKPTADDSSKPDAGAAR